MLKRCFGPQGGSRPGPARHGAAIAHLKPQLRKSLLFTRTHSFASQRIRNAFASHRNRTESDFPFRKLTHLQTQIYTHIYICTYMLGIHDFPKVLIQSGGSHLQHANPVQLFIHTHTRPAPNHKEFLRNPIGILLES